MKSKTLTGVVIKRRYVEGYLTIPEYVYCGYYQSVISPWMCPYCLNKHRLPIPLSEFYNER